MYSMDILFQFRFIYNMYSPVLKKKSIICHSFAFRKFFIKTCFSMIWLLSKEVSKRTPFKNTKRASHQKITKITSIKFPIYKLFNNTKSNK